MTKRVLAFDFGASSGRAIIGCFDGEKITLEEVHRFSVGFHHKKHTKRGLELSLTKIDGIGEKKAKELLKVFKTIKNIKDATVTDLSQVKGINKELAEKIYNYYNGEE